MKSLALQSSLLLGLLSAVSTSSSNERQSSSSNYQKQQSDNDKQQQYDDDSIPWDELGANLDPHPDPNEEHYEDMVYIGRHHHEEDRRLSLNDVPFNGVRFIFGTSFDETHKEIAEEDLLHHDQLHPGESHEQDVADRAHGHKSRAQVLKERRQYQERHKELPNDGMPRPYGHVDTHPLDGGVVPPKVVQVEPFFLDIAPVTNQQFAKFVQSTYYETEAEKYGWSFVLSSFLPSDQRPDPNNEEGNNVEVDPEAIHWVAVQGAYWRMPEGPGSSYKYRKDHPVVHVSHRDAAEYCTWVGKRLPGEREYEAAARAGHYGPSNRTLYVWGDDGHDWDLASQHANLWGPGAFPDVNIAKDGYRGTSPVKHYPPNAYGVYDTIGNVWEWMRGGKHKSRIVKGASYVDTLDGSYNHAATLGARATLHGTTTTGNVGFRCAKSATKRTEYHYKWHDETTHGTLAIEDQFGHRDYIPQRGWEDKYDPKAFFEGDEDEEEGGRSTSLKRKKVVKRVERLSTEL